jgi:hypothetical protein
VDSGFYVRFIGYIVRRNLKLNITVSILTVITIHRLTSCILLPLLFTSLITSYWPTSQLSLLCSVTVLLSLCCYYSYITAAPTTGNIFSSIVETCLEALLRDGRYVSLAGSLPSNALSSVLQYSLNQYSCLSSISICNLLIDLPM